MNGHFERCSAWNARGGPSMGWTTGVMPKGLSSDWKTPAFMPASSCGACAGFMNTATGHVPPDRFQSFAVSKLVCVSTQLGNPGCM